MLAALADKLTILLALSGLTVFYSDMLRGQLSTDVAFGIFASPGILMMYGALHPPWEEKGWYGKLVARLGLLGAGVHALLACLAVAIIANAGGLQSADKGFIYLGLVASYPACWFSGRVCWRSLHREAFFAAAFARGPFKARWWHDDWVGVLVITGIFCVAGAFAFWKQGGLDLVLGCSFALFAGGAAMGVWTKLQQRALRAAMNGELRGAAALRVIPVTMRALSVPMVAWALGGLVRQWDGLAGRALFLVISTVLIFAGVVIFPWIPRKARYRADERGLVETRRDGTGRTIAWSEVAAVHADGGNAQSVSLVLRDGTGVYVHAASLEGTLPEMVLYAVNARPRFPQP